MNSKIVSHKSLPVLVSYWRVWLVSNGMSLPTHRRFNLIISV